LSIQVARFARLQDSFNNWWGQPVEVGGKGSVVSMVGIHHFSPANTPELAAGAQIWGSALSSNPDHAGDLALGLDEFYSSPALYGTAVSTARLITTVTGAAATQYRSIYTPLYGIIRPRRQIWVQYLVGLDGSLRYGIEVYYEEVVGPQVAIDAVDRKFGKYRRS